MNNLNIRSNKTSKNLYHSCLSINLSIKKALRIRKSEVMKLLAECDKDNDGSISFEEFLTVITKKFSPVYQVPLLFPLSSSCLSPLLPSLLSPLSSSLPPLPSLPCPSSPLPPLPYHSPM